MNLFKSLLPLLASMDVTITIGAGSTEGHLVVSVLPRPKINDSEAQKIKPIILRGSADELDAEFLTHVLQPIADVSGIVVKLDEFEKSKEKLDKENAISKAAKEEEKKASDAANKQFEKAESKFNEFKEKNDVDGMERYLSKIQTIEPQTSKISKAVKAMQKDVDDLTPSKPVPQASLFQPDNDKPAGDSIVVTSDGVDSSVKEDIVQGEDIYLPDEQDPLPESNTDMVRASNGIDASSFSNDQVDVFLEERDQKFNQNQSKPLIYIPE